MNGSYDFSSLYGGQTYEEETRTYEFNLIAKDKYDLEKCLQKYGENGYLIWKETNSKKARTLANFIKKYGENEGIIRYNKHCEKLRGKRTLEYFINKFKFIKY